MPTHQARPTRVAVNYRVIWHWRLPVFQRLAACPEYELHVYHGADFPGSKSINATPIDGVPHTQMWTIRWLSNLLRFPQWPLCPFFLLHLWRFRPDVVLTEGNSNLLNNLQLFVYATLTRTPVVFWTLGELRNKSVTRMDQRLFRAVTHWMERRSAALLGYSSVALEYFQRQGYPAVKQFRAVNVVDTDRVLERIERERKHVDAVKEKWQLHHKKVVLFVGAIIAAKRMEDLVDAFEIIAAAEPDARLVIVGDGPYREAVGQYVAKSSVRDRIVMTGKVIEGVSAYFLAADVLVLPHLGGLAISEAMAHGLPIVATVADGCEVDLIEQGMNGYRLPLGDCQAMAEHVLQILNDPQLLLDMKQHARKLIAEKHNVHTYVQGIKDAINFAFASSLASVTRASDDASSQRR